MIKNLTVETLQDTSYHTERSEGFNANVTGGPAGFGAGVGYNYSKTDGNAEWTNNQTGIIAKEKMDIEVEEKTTLEGAVIASQTGDLTLKTKELDYKDVYGHDEQETVGYSVGANAGASPSGEVNPDSLTGSLKLEGYDKEQVARATLGEGSIIVNGAEAPNEELNGLNRDLTNTLETTKDVRTNDFDEDVSVRLKWILDPKGAWNDTLFVFTESWDLTKAGAMLLAEVINNFFKEIERNLKYLVKSGNYFSEDRDKIIRKSKQSRRNVLAYYKYLTDTERAAFEQNNEEIINKETKKRIDTETEKRLEDAVGEVKSQGGEVSEEEKKQWRAEIEGEVRAEMERDIRTEVVADLFVSGKPAGWTDQQLKKLDELYKEKEKIAATKKKEIEVMEAERIKLDEEIKTLNKKREAGQLTDKEAARLDDLISQSIFNSAKLERAKTDYETAIRILATNIIFTEVSEATRKMVEQTATELNIAYLKDKANIDAGLKNPATRDATIKRALSDKVKAVGLVPYEEVQADGTIKINPNGVKVAVLSPEKYVKTATNNSSLAFDAVSNTVYISSDAANWNSSDFSYFMSSLDHEIGHAINKSKVDSYKKTTQNMTEAQRVAYFHSLDEWSQKAIISDILDTETKGKGLLSEDKKFKEIIYTYGWEELFPNIIKGYNTPVGSNPARTNTIHDTNN